MAKKRKKLPPGQAPVRYTLPAEYSRHIGRITTRWAYLEWRLKEAVYAILDLDPVSGRLAIREPRAPDYLDMIDDLLKAHRISVQSNIADIKKGVASAKRYRDMVCHGIWLRVPNVKAPVLQVTSGSYQPAPQQRNVKARIVPQGVEVTVQNLKEIIALVEGATGAVNVLKDEIEKARNSKASELT